MHPHPTPHANTADQAPGRRRPLFTLLSLVMLLLATVSAVQLVPAATAQATQETASTQTAADVAAEVRASVVTVYVWSDAPAFAPGQTGQEPTGAGSGWVYSDDGIVVTNNHVVDGASKVAVVTDDGTQIPAEVVGTDWYRDVAVLRVQPDSGQALPPAATVGDSDRVRAGDEVIAIGTPLGQFANTVTVGHVGATGRALPTGTGYALRNLIQHDASLSPGNSGGPLFSMDGEVIGMNVAKVDAVSTGQAGADDIGFAIASNTVVDAVGQILESGSVAYPYLGVQTQMTTGGVPVVTAVESGSPAEAAGIAPGDVLVAVDGQQVDAHQGFIDLLYQHTTGDTVTITVDRGGSVTDVSVTLGERPVAT